MGFGSGAISSLQASSDPPRRAVVALASCGQDISVPIPPNLVLAAHLGLSKDGMILVLRGLEVWLSA